MELYVEMLSDVHSKTTALHRASLCAGPERDAREHTATEDGCFRGAYSKHPAVGEPRNGTIHHTLPLTSAIL